MKDISNLYPKMLENKSNINKSDIDKLFETRKIMLKNISNIKKTDVDKLFELRKTLGNHWSFSLWGALISDNDEL